MSPPPVPEPPVRHVVVVGAGIAGLAAAHALRQRGGTRLRVTVLEATGTVGGKLRVADFAGVPVDEGAESMLARRPEGLALARAAGLGSQLVHPATSSARIWTRGHLRPLPGGHVLGIPGDLSSLAASRILTAGELARVSLDRLLPRTPYGDGSPDADVAVGRYVAARLGRSVVDRLVEPLLGGVYAGQADNLSFNAAVPQIARAARSSRSLISAARQVQAGALGTATPVFASVRGGLGRLPQNLANRLVSEYGVALRTGAPVRELHRTSTGWRLVLGLTRAPQQLEADAVVLAVPGAAAGRLLTDLAPDAAAQTAAIEYASVAIATLAFPRSAFPEAFPGSGFLVPPVDARTVKAATFSTTKWGWYGELAADLVVVRLSIGRHREEEQLQRDDAELVAAASADLAAAVGVRGRPLDARVSRWGGGLPQYAVGHLGRIARIRRGLASQPTLTVCGAAYDGVGIPACIASGEAAAVRVLDALANGENGRHG